MQEREINQSEFIGNINGYGSSYAGAVWNKDKASPTLTTMQGGGREPMIIETKKLGCLQEDKPHESQTVYSEDGASQTVTAGTHGYGMGYVLVKQATKEGSVPCEIGGVCDLNYVASKTRRGRSIENGQICPTIATENIPNVIEPWIWEINGETYLIRIRKLTPKECWRLMGFTDEDYDKAAEVNSNTQLYKQAGNSIVKQVLMGIFGTMLE